MNIDVHAHFLPKEFIKIVKDKGPRYRAEIVNGDRGEMIVVNGRNFGPVENQLFDFDRLFPLMQKSKLDRLIFSSAPALFYYWAEPELAAETARIVNEEIASVCRKHPENFSGMATVPLQDVERSIDELNYTVDNLNLKGLEIGANVNAEDLDHEKFLPFFKRVEELGIPIFMHPIVFEPPQRMEPYYLLNLIGNPLDTTIAVARMIFSGLFEKCPNLKIILSHSGGLIPWLRGRFDHGYKVRKECKQGIANNPSYYFKNLYFDTITHYPGALKYLIDSVGADSVVLGTDFPFDMADMSPVDTVFAVGDLDEGERLKILGGNVERLFSI